MATFVLAKAATLTLKDNNLSCGPENNCAISLSADQRLQPFPSSKYPIFELLTDSKVSRYYFYSNDIVQMPAYSGKPIGILIGMDLLGNILETRLVHHDEPILLAGIPAKALYDAVSYYEGKNVQDQFAIGGAQPAYHDIDIITGATVTSLVVYGSILQASRIVAQEVGILAHQESLIRNRLSDRFTPMSWQELLEIGAITHLIIYPQEIGLPKREQPLLDLYFANLSPPSIGINLLGRDEYTRLLERLKPGESAIIIVANGDWNFKGTAFARGGLFDRFHIEQGLNTITFRDSDYENLYSFLPSDAPLFTQSGIFIIRDPTFDNTSPWELVLLVSRLTGETAQAKTYKEFYANYTLPSVWIEKAASIYKTVWLEKMNAIILYVLFWLLVILIFIFKRRISQYQPALEATHITVLAIAVALIGLYFANQPSIVNIFTFITAIKTSASLGVIFLDPLNAIAWGFLLITLILWGRPLFCGWVCPFGALQELLYKLRIRITPFHKSYEFGPKTRRLLKPLRYIILLLLVIVAVLSLPIAERLAEIEPFKTTWNIGVLHRPPFYGLYVGLLLFMGLFTIRFFCRYLCPLGAAFSLISFIPHLPYIKIKRRGTCMVCRKCRMGCSTFAIDNKGRIHSAECLGCFECINKMYDKSVCPPLKSKKLWDKYEAKKR